MLTSPSALDQSVTISAGRDQGIELEDVVVTNQGLVGTVSKVLGDESRVTLITDPSQRGSRGRRSRTSPRSGFSSTAPAAYRARPRPRRQGQAAGRLRRHDHDRRLAAPAARSRRSSRATSRSAYVSSVGQTDTDIFKNIQVQPFVDLSSLESVLVLIPKKRAAAAHR